jgi:hypothetical protein
MNLGDAIKLASVFSMILVIIGTAFNLISFAVCSQKRLNRNNTFKLIMFSCISDIISLYAWLLQQFVFSFFNFDIQRWNLFFCRFSEFYQYSSLQYSSWMLVIDFIFVFCFLFSNYYSIFCLHIT